MTSSWIRADAYKRNERREHTTHRERPCEEEAEAGVMWPPAKGHLEPPEAGRRKEGFPRVPKAALGFSLLVPRANICLLFQAI